MELFDENSSMEFFFYKKMVESIPQGATLEEVLKASVILVADITQQLDPDNTKGALELIKKLLERQYEVFVDQKL